jgi:hypothetical protein
LKKGDVVVFNGVDAKVFDVNHPNNFDLELPGGVWEGVTRGEFMTKKEALEGQRAFTNWFAKCSLKHAKQQDAESLRFTAYVSTLQVRKVNDEWISGSTGYDTINLGRRSDHWPTGSYCR